MHLIKHTFEAALIVAFTITHSITSLYAGHEGTVNDQVSSKNDTLRYRSENLVITQVSQHVYLHTSFLNTQSFGKVDCNGIIVVNDGEAIVFDTPADDKSAEELIEFAGKQLKAKIRGVIATHFHVDCIGGLKAFHESQIPSYANQSTIDILKSKKVAEVIPQHGFESKIDLKIGNRQVHAEYFGAGHTRDNIIGYFADDQVMFGGCLIKANGAGKGNLEDADVVTWPETVRKIKQTYRNVKVVIPGHGNYGGEELLDYTITLFQ
ncbi:MAG TPA: subclass B1 metallo-beta-lactamase [Chryseolinea sp.]|nr:subclass B1 metallo-beta-lactamase [Chryseolinea sp.]